MKKKIPEEKIKSYLKGIQYDKKEKEKENEGPCVIIRKASRKEIKEDRARRLEEGRHDEAMRLNYALREGMAFGFVQGCAESSEIKKTVSFFCENKFPVDFIQSYFKNIYKKEKKKPPKKISKMTREEKEKEYKIIMIKKSLGEQRKFEIARRKGIGTVRVKTIALMRKNNFPEEKIQDYLKNMQESAERDQDDNQE